MANSNTYLLRFLVITIVAAAIVPIIVYEVNGVSTSSSRTAAAVQSSANVAAVQSEPKHINTGPLRLVLHVGLPKTATSAIQCRLSDMEKRQVLSEISTKIVEIESCRTDQFLHKIKVPQYLERFPFVDPNEINNQTVTETSNKFTTYDRVIKGSSVLQHCLDVWIKHYDRVAVPDCWGMSYKKYIQNYHEQGTSIFVISNENLALPPFGSVPESKACGTIFNNMLDSLGDKSEIDIVLTYRLHFDRMISMIGQEYDGEKFFTRPKLTRWPEDGGHEVPFLENYINDFPVDRLAQAISCFRYASKNPRIHFKVIDFHIKQPGIVTSFMQVVTRNATLTQQLAEGNHIVGTENIAMERDRRIQFDRIAVAAKKAGLVPKSAARNEVRNAVSKYFDEKGLKVSDMKLKCPPAKFFDDLTNTTVMIHQMSFPDVPVQAVRNKLRMFDFQSFRDIFCEVDGDASLHDEVMKSFVEQYKS